MRKGLSTALVCLSCLLLVASSAAAQSAPRMGLGSINGVAVQAELKTVKLYGAGGIAGLDTYQSGFFIDEAGHILTVWSTVLDIDKVIAVTSDGRRLEASVVGVDPNLEIAVLETKQSQLEFFELKTARDAEVGERVLALSNLFGIATGREMASVQKGVVMARTRLDARRGTFTSVYQGPIYVIDAMTNNPGAAGGALTDFQGRLLGMLGKELRDARAGVWLNYAIPISQLKTSVENILTGKPIAKVDGNKPAIDKPHSLLALGITLVPDILPKTPAYVDSVQPGSPAAKAGLKNDDLILSVNSTRVTSQVAFRQELQGIDRGDTLTLLVQRGT
jgi:serine protease Do